MKRTLILNGANHVVDTADDMPLLWVIRDRLGLTGAKYGCGVSLCGACTVHIDGQPTRACSVAMKDLGSARVVTIEGLAGPVAVAVLKAWDDLDVAQCGYCQPGQVMSAIGLLTVNPAPTEQDIEAAMTGNVCRCAAYSRIRQAISAAAAALAA